MRIVFAIAALTFSITQAHAEGCRDATFVCGDFKLCLSEGVDNDTNRIREGARTGNGQIAYDGADACWKDFDKNNRHNYREWSGHTAGCLPDDYAKYARQAVGGSC